MTPPFKTRHFLPLFLGAVFSMPASAAVVSSSLSGVSSTVQLSIATGSFLRLAQSYTVPYTYSDPLTINTANNTTYTTQGAGSLTHTANTPAYQEVNAYIAGYGQQYGGSGQQGQGGYAVNTLDTSITFTLDSPGNFTFSSTNTAITVDLGATQNYFQLKLDEAFLLSSNLTNTTYSIPLSAGEHTIKLYVWIGTNVGYDFASTGDYGEIQATSRYKFQITSIPEPTTTMAAMVAMLGWPFRRKRI